MAGEGTPLFPEKHVFYASVWQCRWTRPQTYFPNAVLAEVFVVAENDDFAGHGCTDAEPVLNLKAPEEKERHWCVQ